MLKVGAKDAFERLYTQKFREFAGRFGEFVAYERDRGARDIGIHLTAKLKSGEERLSSALCWFQLKGAMSGTLPKEDFGSSDVVKLSLKVRHLQYWFLQPMPTYLGLYIESADTFLVLNLQKYVTERWGRTIFELKQDEVTVEVPRSSVLDDQAFSIILARNDVDEWVKVLGADAESTRLCRRDYDLIWHIGTASHRTVQHRAHVRDWQSKMRGEVYIQENRPDNADAWTDLRAHWQSGLSAEDLERVYPYIGFYSLGEHGELLGQDVPDADCDPVDVDPVDAEDDEEDDSWWRDDDDRGPLLRLSNGEVVEGVDCAGEYYKYILGVRLNRVGRQLFDFVKILQQVGLIEIHEGMSEFISIAPWHARSV